MLMLFRYARKKKGDHDPMKIDRIKITNITFFIYWVVTETILTASNLA